MKKLNSVVYHKLLLQAQEAKLQKLTKLSNAVLAAVGPVPEDENVSYQYAELQEEVYQGLWKLATNVIKYYDVNSVDVSKVHTQLEALANRFIEEVEKSIDMETQKKDRQKP